MSSCRSGTRTGWDPTTPTNLAKEFVSSGQWDTIDGVWTSGMDSQVGHVRNQLSTS